MTAIKFDRHNKSVRLDESEPFWPKRVIEGGCLATADIVKLAAGVGVELVGKIVGRVLR